MRTILVDDEEWALNTLKNGIENEDDIDIVGTFLDADDALDYAKTHKVDFALLDVQMPGMDGIELGRELRKINSQIIIIYVSGYPEFFSEAYKNVRADYYMLKPYKPEDLKDVLERARLLSKRQKKRVQFRTFGRFDMFVDEQPVQFTNKKAKELMAICVDHEGGIVTMEEAIDKLWEGSPFNENVKTRYRKAIAYLNALMAEYRVPDVFVSGYKNCHIKKEKVECDYYEFLDSADKPIFFGEYMNDYSWAEERAGWLAMQLQNKKMEKF